MNTLKRAHPALLRFSRFTGICALLVSLFMTAAARADRSLRILDERPLVVEGDVLAIPIRCSDPGSRRSLPEEVTLRMDDGRVTGTVLWLGVSINDLPDSEMSTWTRPIADLKTIPPPSTRAEREQARGFILCALPPGYRGAFTLGRNRIEPRWLPPLDALTGPELTPELGPAWPSLDDPGSWWRWMLIARHEGRRPPEPRGDAAARLLARQIGGLWSAGIERLARVSPGTASELLELLVARCRTPDLTDVATWITDPTELGSILDLMLDQERDDDLVVRSVLSFLDARFPLLAWVELETGSRVRIGVANPTDGEQVVRMQWIEGDPIPSGAVVPAGSVIMVDLDRPVIKQVRAQTDLKAVSPSSEFLLTCGRLEKRLRFTSERLQARPPGLCFQPFFLPLCLSDVWEGTRRLPPSQWSSNAILRKRLDQWELFIECMDGGGAPEGEDVVEIWFGPPETPIRVIQVGSEGSLSFIPDGSRFRGGTLRVKRFKDRWRAVLTLDSSLIEAASAPGVPNSLQIGLRRLVDGRLLSIAGASTPPWNGMPPAYLVELSEWGEVLSDADSTQK